MRRSRSPERIAHHYAIERRLADRLRNSSAEERPGVYAEVYRELFAEVNDHPQLTKRVSIDDRIAKVEQEIALFAHLLQPDTAFLEIGAGDCAVSLAVARRVRAATAVDVARIIPNHIVYPPNFGLHLSRGTDLGVPEGSISLAYSNQLMEHLHPDDAVEQLRNIATALTSGGIYVCVTPSRLTGPHDVSCHFDPVAKGLHLKEYSAGELCPLFLANGFSAVMWHVGVHGRFFRIPIAAASSFEYALEVLPHRLRRAVAGTFPLRNLLNGIVVAIK